MHVVLFLLGGNRESYHYHSDDNVDDQNPSTIYDLVFICQLLILLAA